MIATVDGDVTEGKGQGMITVVDGEVIVLVCFYRCDKTLTINGLKDERVIISSYSFRSQSIRTATLTTHSPSTVPSARTTSSGVALPGVG